MRIQHLGVLASLLLAGLGSTASSAAPKPVDAARLRAADSEPGQWLMDGRNYSAQRYSTLRSINESNVKELGLAWYAELDTLRGVEATPLFVDGVIYNISAWNITSAYNAKTGKRLWTYDPKVPREMGRYACCEPVARGLAFWKGKVIIATLDGRLIGLNAKNGKPVWTAQTFTQGLAVFHHRRAARIRRHGGGRQWWRGSWRARLRQRLGRGHRQVPVEILSRAR